MEGALQELDETSIGWNCYRIRYCQTERLKPLMDECEELTAMFVTMVKNVKNRR